MTVRQLYKIIANVKEQKYSNNNENITKEQLEKKNIGTKIVGFWEIEFANISITLRNQHKPKVIYNGSIIIHKDTTV